MDFVCPICLEGGNTEPSRLHPCGVHRYHLKCLFNHHFHVDKRCIVCGRSSRAGIIPAATCRHVTAANCTCVCCQGHLDHSCYEIDACHHVLHVSCFYHLLMTYGITATGQVFCPQCREYK